MTYAVTSSSAACSVTSAPTTVTTTTVIISGTTLINVNPLLGQGASVTATGVGSCDITASVPGSNLPSVTRRVTILPAPLTVTASSPTITYGQPTPAITPSYSGFKRGDTAAVVTAAATCTATPNR